MFFLSTLLPSTIIILIILIAIVLWRRNEFKQNRRIIVSAIITLVTLQLFIYLQGKINPFLIHAPTSNKIIAIITIVFAYATVLQLLKKLVIEFLVTGYKINIPPFILDIINWIVIIITALWFISFLFGIELTGLLVGSTVLSAVIGLSLQEILSDLFVGVVLQMETPFVIGDWVELAGEKGCVVAQSWRTTSIMTHSKNFVIFTNSNVASERIINYSRPNPVQRQDITFGIDENAPPNYVKQVLQESMMKTKGILKDPPPVAHVTAFGDSEVLYTIRYWIDDFSLVEEIQDRVLSLVWYSGKRAGIEPSTPERDVNISIIKIDKELHNETRDVIRSISFLEDLDDAQIKRLADITELKLYTVDEPLVLQGDEGDSVFIIKSGIVGVYIVAKDGSDLRVDERIAGEFFGEMSLLTGNKRTASCIAETEVEVLIIGKEGFVEVLTADPTILQVMLDALDKRRLNLEHKKTADENRLKEKIAAERSSLMLKIKGFLGISL